MNLFSQNADSTTLTGILERIVYLNPDNGYTVARLQEPRRKDLTTIVGNLLGANVGETLRLEGRWVTDPRYGRQFKIEGFRAVTPATLNGMQRYLGSGLIRGIGPVLAKRLVAKFGDQTLDVIEHEPDRLREVEGVG